MKRPNNPDEVEAGTRSGPGDLNASPLDLIIITSAQHYVNRYRIGQAIARLPSIGGPNAPVWWVCEFARPVRTPLGWMYFCCVEDKNLRRVCGEVKRFRYPIEHYQLLPLLAKVTAPHYAAA